MNAFLLGARSDAIWAINTITRLSGRSQHQSLINSQDMKGWKALHHAANNRSHALFSALAHLIKVSDLPALDGLTPLIIASSKGYDDVVEVILQLPGRQSQNSLTKATVAAILNGHASLLDRTLRPSSINLPKSSDALEAVIEAIKLGHTSVVVSVWHDNAYRSKWRHSCRLEILYAAVHRQQLDLVLLVLGELNYLSSSELADVFIKTNAHGLISMTKEMFDFLSVHSKHEYSDLGAWILTAAVHNGYDQLASQVLSSSMEFGFSDRLFGSTFKEGIRSKNTVIMKLLLKYVSLKVLQWFLEYVIETNNLEVAELLFGERIEGFPDLFCLAAITGSDSMFRSLLKCVGRQDDLYKASSINETPMDLAALRLD